MCVGSPGPPSPRPNRTWVSGSSEPRLAAPSLTTSASWVIVAAEDWAAWASLSGVDAAPDTSSLVSSTKALAVFRMFSLEGESRWEGRDKNQVWLLTVGEKETLQRGFLWKGFEEEGDVPLPYQRRSSSMQGVSSVDTESITSKTSMKNSGPTALQLNERSASFLRFPLSLHIRHSYGNTGTRDPPSTSEPTGWVLEGELLGISPSSVLGLRREGKGAGHGVRIWVDSSSNGDPGTSLLSGA